MNMPFNRALYAENWEQISHNIKCRAGWQCEGSPAYPGCRARQYFPHPHTGARVILTVAHLDHNPQNNGSVNLRAMCQRCHLTYDAAHHARNAARTRHRKIIEAGQIEIVFV